jgi:hypothetical protein
MYTPNHHKGQLKMSRESGEILSVGAKILYVQDAEDHFLFSHFQHGL